MGSSLKEGPFLGPPVKPPKPAEGLVHFQAVLLMIQSLHYLKDPEL